MLYSDPELFSLIHTLSWSSSPDDASVSCVHVPTLLVVQLFFHQVVTSTAQYLFCYVCYTQQNSSYQIISSSEDSSCEAGGISEVLTAIMQLHDAIICLIL